MTALVCGNCGHLQGNYCWRLMAFQRADFHSCGEAFAPMDTLAGMLAARTSATSVDTLLINQVGSDFRAKAGRNVRR